MSPTQWKPRSIASLGNVVVMGNGGGEESDIMASEIAFLRLAVDPDYLDCRFETKGGGVRLGHFVRQDNAKPGAKYMPAFSCLSAQDARCAFSRCSPGYRPRARVSCHHERPAKTHRCNPPCFSCLLYKRDTCQRQCLNVKADDRRPIVLTRMYPEVEHLSPFGNAFTEYPTDANFFSNDALDDLDIE